MTYTMLRDGQVRDDEGQLIPVVTDPETIQLVVDREVAKGWVKHWAERVKAIETELRALQSVEVAAYDGVVLAIRESTTYTTDTKALADYLYDNPVEVSDLLALIAASKGFTKGEMLPQSVAGIVAEMTETKHSPYFASSIARRAEKRDAWEGV